MVLGIVELSWWGVVLIALGLTHITIAAVTIYLHRCQAHRALTLNPVAALFFRTWLWLTTGMRTKVWTAVHRKHHAEVDSDADPHSPQIHGLPKVLAEGAELYRQAASDSQMITKYGRGTPDDWFERRIFAHDKVGIGSMLVLNVVLFGPIGLTIWAVQMAWIPFFAAGVINGVGHHSGYRNFETTDASTNISPWGILIGGEELHNNHHAFASSARFASKPWEFDIGWLYIRVLSALGLANVKKVASVPRLDNGKSIIDLDTVTAVITGRFHVMADYARQVVNQVHREELSKAHEESRRLIKQTRALIVREDSQMNDAQRELLHSGLEVSAPLAVVYEFRQQLHAIFTQHAATPEGLLAQLQQWCREAEQTGINALQEFAATMCRYAPSLARA